MVIDWVKVSQCVAKAARLDHEIQRTSHDRYAKMAADERNDLIAEIVAELTQDE